MNKPCNVVDLKRIINLKYPLSIISLGRLCYSRTFPERFHIYNFKKNKVRMPFDGCITPYHDMCKLINTDFFQFSENLFAKDSYIYNKNFDIIYNHEKTTDILSITKQFNKRKYQFINYIKNSIENQHTIIFFLCYNDYPEELIYIIKNKYPELKFKVFILDWEIYSKVKPISKTFFSTYINIPKPSKDYSEWRDRETVKGKEFEKKVLYNFLIFLSEITGVKYDLEKIYNNRALSV